MATVRRLVHASPDRLWAVLADGWRFPLWVVGAARMRAVDAGWPAVGAALHHSVGLWPLLLDDTTSVLECDPGRRLLLQARGWPLGAARVEMVLRPAGANRTEVTMVETPSGGPALLGRLAPADWVLAKRNEESLLRLARLAEERSAPQE